MSSYDPVFAALDRTTVFQELGAAAVGDEYPVEVEPFSSCTWWMLGQMVAALRLRPDDVLVDLGCGRGGVGLWLARALSAQLLGLDGSGVATAAASRRAAGFGLAGRSEFRVADFAETGLPDGHAAAVVSVDALPFAQDRDAALVEAHRILRPGGRLVFSCAEPPAPTDPTWAERLASAGFDLEDRIVDEDFMDRWSAIYAQLVAHADRVRAELGAQAAEVLLTEATTEQPVRDGLLLVARRPA